MESLPVSTKTKRHYREFFHHFFEFSLKFGYFQPTNWHCPNPVGELDEQEREVSLPAGVAPGSDEQWQENVVARTLVGVGLALIPDHSPDSVRHQRRDHPIVQAGGAIAANPATYAVYLGNNATSELVINGSLTNAFATSGLPSRDSLVYNPNGTDEIELVVLVPEPSTLLGGVFSFQLPGLSPPSLDGQL